MVEQPRYSNTLFLIFENVHDMIFDLEPGGGTAVLRLYCPQHYDEDTRPPATGIPTGWTRSSGFTHMDAQVKGAIDSSFDRVETLLMKYEYDKIVYSCDPEKPRLIGCGIFKESLCDEVIQYISKKIHKIQKRHRLQMHGHPKPPCKSLESISKYERVWLAPTAKAIFYGARLRSVIRKKHPQLKWTPHYDPTHPEVNLLKKAGNSNPFDP